MHQYCGIWDKLRKFQPWNGACGIITKPLGLLYADTCLTVWQFRWEPDSVSQNVWWSEYFYLSWNPDHYGYLSDDKTVFYLTLLIEDTWHCWITPLNNTSWIHAFSCIWSYFLSHSSYIYILATRNLKTICFLRDTSLKSLYFESIFMQLLSRFSVSSCSASLYDYIGCVGLEFYVLHSGSSLLMYCSSIGD